MKKVILLQFSQYLFELDASKIFNPDKYELYLITNSFCADLVTSRHNDKYYTEISVTNDYSISNIFKIANTIIKGSNDFDVITISEETMPICGEVRKLFGI